MTARGGSRDTEAIGVDPVVLGVITDEPHSPVHVLDDLGNGIAGLAAVDDGEDGVASIGQRLDEDRQNRLVRGDESRR